MQTVVPATVTVAGQPAPASSPTASPPDGAAQTVPAPSLKDRVSELADQLLQVGVIVRVTVVLGLVWLWVTLLGLTISLSQEILTSRDLVGFANLFAIPTAAFTWLHLRKLTMVILDLLVVMLQVFVGGTTHYEGTEKLKRELSTPLSELIEATRRWAKAFISTWVILLIVKSIAVAVSSALLLPRFGRMGY